MSFLLKFTPLPKDGIGHYHPPTADAYFFVRLGDLWAHNPQHRYIEATSPNIVDAAQFDTEEAANETWCRAGKPGGWHVIEAPHA